MLRTRPAPQGAGRSLVFLLAVVLGVLLSTPARAHDIPDEIVLHGFIKPEGDRLHFLVRVPLVMLLSMNLPKRGPGYLDLPQIDDKLLASAAAAAKEIQLYENGEPLTPGRVVARISQASDESFESVRESARQHRGAEAAGHDRRVLEPGVLRRAPRVSDPLGALRFLARHAARRRGCGAGSSWSSGSCRPTGPCAPTSYTGAPAM